MKNIIKVYKIVCFFIGMQFVCLQQQMPLFSIVAVDPVTREVGLLQVQHVSTTVI